MQHKYSIFTKTKGCVCQCVCVCVCVCGPQLDHVLTPHSCRVPLRVCRTGNRGRAEEEEGGHGLNTHFHAALFWQRHCTPLWMCVSCAIAQSFQACQLGFSSDNSLGTEAGKPTVYFSVANVFCVCVNACIQEIKKETEDSSESKQQQNLIAFFVPHLKYGCAN